MTRWTVDVPTALELGNVTELNVRLAGGTVAVLASDDRPSLAVSELSGRPLLVTHEDGVVTIGYESLSWEGLLSLLGPRKDSAAVTIIVPASCPVQLQSASGPVRTEFDSLRNAKAPAAHTVSGNVGAGTGHVSVTSMSGAVTLLRRAPIGMESTTR